MRNFWVVLVIFLGLLINVAVSEELTLMHDEFNENVKVSGDRKAGVMYQTNKNQIDMKDLIIYAPTDTFLDEEKVCISIKSFDGKYYAFAEIKDVILTESKKYEVLSRHLEKLKSYTSDKIVVLAWIEKNCRRTTGKTKYIPTSWGERINKDLLVYVNSSNTTAYYSIDRDTEVIPCKRLDGRDAITYDAVCEITGEPDTSRLRIYSKAFGSQSEPYGFRIVQTN